VIEANFLVVLEGLVFHFATILCQKCRLPLMACQKISGTFLREKRLPRAVPRVLVVVVMWQSGTIMWQTALTEGLSFFFAMFQYYLLSCHADKMKKI
jgi:hypothetical protein